MIKPIKTFFIEDYKPKESFKCEACGKSFMTEMMLKYHECTAKKQDEDEFKCSECGKQYWSQRMLDIHKKVKCKLVHFINPS